MPKLLLVADAEWVVNEVKAALAIGNWEIDASAEPARAAGRAVSGDYQAVVVDMQVSSMGGMAVIRAIRQAAGEGARPRLVLLLDRVADRFIARRSGADAAVLKPLQANDLRTALQQAPVPVAAPEEE